MCISIQNFKLYKEAHKKRKSGMMKLGNPEGKTKIPGTVFKILKSRLPDAVFNNTRLQLKIFHCGEITIFRFQFLCCGIKSSGLLVHFLTLKITYLWGCLDKKRTISRRKVST